MIQKKEIKGDKKRSLELIAAEVVKDPLATNKQIAERAGVSERTVERRKMQVSEIVGKDDRILALTDLDYDLTMLSTREQLRRIEEEGDKIKTGDLIAMTRESAKRYSIFKGEATDKEGGLKVNIVNYGDIEPVL